MLNRIKIGPKIIGGFLLTAILTTVVGVVGIVNLKKIDNMDTYLYENATRPLEDVAILADRFQRIRVNLYKIMTTIDQGNKDVTASFIKRIHSYQDEIDKVAQHYESTLLDKSDSLAYNEYLKHHEQFEKNTSELISMANQNYKGSELIEINKSDTYVNNIQEVQNSIEKIIELNVNAAKTISDNNTKTANAASTIMVVVLIIAVILALSLGILLTLSITTPLQKVVSVANLIAEKDLAALGEIAVAVSQGDISKDLSIQSNEIQINSKDEIGLLANSFNNIITSLHASGKAFGTMNTTLRNLIGETNNLATQSANGNLSTRGNAGSFKGAYKEIIDGLNLTMEAISVPVNEAADTLEKIANRDLTSRMNGTYKGDFSKIKSSVNAAADNLDQALLQVVQATEQVSSASQQISAGAQNLAQGANEQAASLEEISSSLEEMSSMTKQNAENSNQAKTLADEATTNVNHGNEAMQHLGIAIGKIKESSDQTAKIIKTIDEIAMQTNLLALNAAVEAARAGEAGRGFAVVAEEVRNLAQRSAQAAKNTAEMIENAVKNAEDGVQITTDVTKSFDFINTSVKKVNDLIGEIAAASREQAQGINQVNIAVTQMDKVTQQNAANSEESASASEELSSQSQELANMISQFKVTQEQQNFASHAQVTKAIEKMTQPQNTHTQFARKNSNTTSGISLHKNGNKKSPIHAEEIIPMDTGVLKDF